MALYDDAFNSIIVNYVKDKWADNIFNGLPLTTWYLNTGSIREREMGGKSIIEDVIVAKNTSFGCIGFYDTITLKPEEYTKQADFAWKMFGGGVELSLAEISMASNSRLRMANLIEKKMKVSEMSAADNLNTLLHGLNNGDSVKFLGLQDLVSDTVTIGGLNPTTVTQWKAYVEGSAGILSLDDMMAGYLSVSQPMGVNSDGKPDGSFGDGLMIQPDLILTTKVLWQRYHQQLTPTIRHEAGARVGKYGFQGLVFEKAMVLWDAAVPTGVLYYLNSQFQFFTFGLDENKKAITIGELTKVPGRPVKASELYAMVVHHTDNRRYLGKLTGRTAV